MVRISFLGDLSLNDDYNDLYDRGENPFKEVYNQLEKSDLVIANLECFAKGDNGENYNKIPRLKTNLKTLNYLKDINLSLAATANNHVHDNLDDGYRKTQEFLQASYIKLMGSGFSEKEALGVKKIVIKDHKFCFFNYVTEDTNPKKPKDSSVYLNIFSEKKAVAEINKNNDCDFRIVLIHWGGRFEGCSYPDPKLRRIGRALIDAGADLIIGHHSHTLQPFDTYKGKYIFYSMGNFCFSDIVSDNKKYKLREKNRKSAILNIEFSGNKYKFSFFPIYNKDCNIIQNERYINKIRSKQLFYKLFTMIWPIWIIYVKFINVFEPLIYQVFRKDEQRTFFDRLKNLNVSKIKGFIFK